MTTIRVPAAVTTLLAALVLAGCNAGTSSGTGAGTQGATGSALPTTISSPGIATPSSSADGATSSPAATSPTASGSPDALRSDRCTAQALAVSFTPTGAAAGSMFASLVLTNTGTQRCTLQGWPGVSFVGDGNGTQIGAAATFDRSSPHGTVTLDPGKAAHAPMRVARAENYPADTCRPVTADGLRVYPPGSTDALFVATTGLTACRNADVQLLDVQGLLPGS